MRRARSQRGCRRQRHQMRRARAAGGHRQRHGRAHASSRSRSPAAARPLRHRRCSATSRTATTTASCSRACSPAATTRRTSSSTRWPGTTTNGVTLHAGVARRADRPRRAHGARARTASSNPTTRWSSPPAAALRPAARRAAERRRHAASDGVFVFRTLDDCDSDHCLRERRAQTAAVIGGGLLGLEAARGLLNHGLEVHVVHLMPHLMDVQLDAAAGDDAPAALEAHGRPRPRRRANDRRARRRAGHGSRVRGRRHARLRHGRRSPRASGPTSSSRARPASTVERGIVVGDDLAVARRPGRLRRRRVRAAPRPGLRAGRSALGAGAGARRPAHRTEPDARLQGSQVSHQAQGDGRRAGGHGRARSRRTSDEVVQLLRADARHLQEADRARRHARRRDPARRPCVARRRCCRLFDRGTRLPETPRRAALPLVAAATPRRQRRRPARRRADLQLQRRHQGRGSSTRSTAGCRSFKARLRCHAGRHGLRLVQAAGPGSSWRRAPATAWRTTRGALLRARRAADQAGAGRRDPRARSCAASPRCFDALADGKEDRRARPASRRCSRRSGARTTTTSATRASSTTACTPTSRSDGTFCVVPRIYGGVTTPASCGASPTWPTSTRCRW